MENPETGIVRIDNATGKCRECGEITRFADIDYQMWICSTECSKQWSDKVDTNLKSLTTKK